MTREETKEAIKVMQAYVDGKEIEASHKDCDIWDITKEPRFNWFTTNYRIKPTPKYRPWKPEEVPIGKLVRSKIYVNSISLINGVSESYVYVYYKKASTLTLFNENEVSYDQGKTWQPCGVLE